MVVVVITLLTNLSYIASYVYSSYTFLIYLQHAVHLWSNVIYSTKKSQPYHYLHYAHVVIQQQSWINIEYSYSHRHMLFYFLYIRASRIGKIIQLPIATPSFANTVAYMCSYMVNQLLRIHLISYQCIFCINYNQNMYAWVIVTRPAKIDHVSTLIYIYLRIMHQFEIAIHCHN